jgi:hypothetical protein
VDALSGAFARLVQEGQLILRQPISDILCKPFQLPADWPQVYGIAIDWRQVSVLWGAWDFESNTLYIHQEYGAPRTDLALHAEHIRARGASTLGMFNPLADGRSKDDGMALYEQLSEHHLDLFVLEAGEERALIEVVNLLSEQRLRVFDNLEGWATEYCNYRRDEKGRPNDEDSPLMQATKLMAISGALVARSEEEPTPAGWDRCRSQVTGY